MVQQAMARIIVLLKGLQKQCITEETPTDAYEGRRVCANDALTLRSTDSTITSDLAMTMNSTSTGHALQPISR